ncbi:DUF805 domain-containing protein [Rheinheimera sp. WS51]|uniref:DUF805 domain-containing protein n=1 Tax=Rheinheimera sp. WS51 TaxID=3425886 RepID=UPI003D8B4917
MEHFIGAFKKFADFTGRARRTEYWMFVLISMIISVVLSVVLGFVGLEALSLLYSLAVIIPSISIATRRLHDTGRSGWWQLIALIPIIGFIVLIVFLAQDSHDANEYGPNPKATI